jgi:hypothetical protein
MDAVIPLAGEREGTDRWGNFRGDPFLIIEERHGGNFIKIMVYRAGNTYYYGYQVKMGGMIRQQAANAAGEAFSTPDLARMAASQHIEKLCGTNRNTRKLFVDFTRIRYSQGTLFSDD